MARVLVVGAGLSGLSVAMEASVRGHHVVVLEKRTSIGGRASSEMKDGFPIAYGPHFLLKKGPLHQLVRKVSKVKPSVLPLRPHRVELLGDGMMQPRKPMMDAVLYRRAIKSYDRTHTSVQASVDIASWGLGDEERSRALLNNNLLTLKEGWSGLVGRLAVTLDEVGIPIETGAKVITVEKHKVHLSDGRHVEADVVILACGYGQSRKLIPELPDIEFRTASTIDVALDAMPLGDRHAILDTKHSMAIFDMKQIHPGIAPAGALLSAIHYGEGRGEDRLSLLRTFMDERAPGWKAHILHERQQKNVKIAPLGGRIGFGFARKSGILLTGAWIESDHILSDGAVAASRLAAEHISKMPLQQ
jgi:phytoene dehydrogenase-like protein